MCEASAPPAPTPDPQIAQAANAQAALGREYLDFAKEQFKVSQERQRDIDALSSEISTYFMDIAKGDRERYETVFRPLEDEFIKTAQEFDSPERQAEAAARAKANVQAEAATQSGIRERQAASYGIRPDSGRFAGVERAADLNTVATSVGAQNQARDAVRDKGLELKKDAISLGQNLQTTSANAATTGLNAATAANREFLASQGIVQPGYSSAQQGYGAQANAYGDLYRNQIGIWNTQNEVAASNASGFGNALGTAAGIGLTFLSSKKAKTNRKKVPEGEALEAVEAMPVESYDYKQGMGDEGSHVGPMAEDFAAETGKGDGTRINVQDALGVTMGAVKDLSAKVNSIMDAIGIGTPTQPSSPAALGVRG